MKGPAVSRALFIQSRRSALLVLLVVGTARFVLLIAVLLLLALLTLLLAGLLARLRLVLMLLVLVLVVLVSHTLDPPKYGCPSPL